MKNNKNQQEKEIPFKSKVQNKHKVKPIPFKELLEKAINKDKK